MRMRHPTSVAISAEGVGMNFAKLFEDCAERNLGKTALICGSRSMTYGELDASAARFASAMARLGVESQKKTVILSKNNTRCVEVMLGCFKANVVSCLVNARLSPYEVAGMLVGDDVALVAFDEGSLDQARHLRAKLPCTVHFVALDEASAREEGALFFDVLVDGESAGFSSVDAADDDVAIQLFTSGSTGAPKAVLHGHRGLAFFMAMFGFAAKHDLIQEEVPTQEVILGLLSPYHISGFTTLYALVSGATVILQESFKMEAFLDAVQEYRVTRATVPATVIEWMLARDDLEKWDLSSLVELSYGGSPISRASVERAMSALNCTLTQAYGSTESLIVSVLSGFDHLKNPREGDRRAYSAGKALIGAEVKVVDEEGAACPAGTDGEIAVRSPSVMLKYRGMTRGESGFDENGWLRMGDVGRMDEHGFLHVTGRKSDLIISGGENIYPKEVEMCIALLEDDVDSVVVVGAPSVKWGETPVAFVVRKPGSALTEEQVRRHCESRIAHFKRPSAVVFLEEIPKDALGKVLRDELKDSIKGMRL